LRHVKEPYNGVGVAFGRLNLTGHLLPLVPPFADRGLLRCRLGAPLEINGVTKSGVSTISLGRLHVLGGVQSAPQTEGGEGESSGQF
jgi:hypothetical protein